MEEFHDQGGDLYRQSRLIRQCLDVNELMGDTTMRFMILVNATRTARRVSTEGPFAETELEIRQAAEAEDFADQLIPELREQEARLRRETASRR